MPWDAPGSTAIVVLTPEAGPLIGELYRVHSNGGGDGMTPHVTLLVPFIPTAELDTAVDRRLQGVLRSFEPFDYALTRVERFGDEVLYLAPEPSKPFIELTTALWLEFPDCPPYGGIHDDVVPHVTVADSAAQALFARITAQVGSHLPVACRAEAVTLVGRGADLRWQRRAGYPLGG